MFKKNKGFVSVLLIFIAVFGVLINRMENIKQQKMFEQSLLNKDKASQNSVIVKQAELNEAQKFSGILVNNANEFTHIELNWDFSVANISKSELLLNNKVVQNLPLTTKKTNINVVENNLSPENNEFTLLLTTNDNKQIPTTISVSAGYIYDIYYNLSKINEDYVLEFSYITNTKSPVSLPKAKEIGQLKLDLIETPTYINQGNFKKTVLKYKLDISSLPTGNNRVVLLWEIESINYQFSQILDITK